MLTDERNQLQQERDNLQQQLDQVIENFQELWPTITNVVKISPEDISACSVVERSIHITVACSNFGNTNKELRESLIAKPALPDPSTVYAEKVVQR